MICARVRATPGRTRTLRVVAPDGSGVRLVSHAELVTALLVREGYQRSLVVGRRPTEVRCARCRRAIEVRPIGTVPNRCRRGEGCRVPRWTKGVGYWCLECGKRRSRSAKRCRACAAPLHAAELRAQPREERAERMRRRMAALSAEERSAGARHANAGISRDARARGGRAAGAARREAA